MSIEKVALLSESFNEMKANTYFADQRIENSISIDNGKYEYFNPDKRITEKKLDYDDYLHVYGGFDTYSFNVDAFFDNEKFNDILKSFLPQKWNDYSNEEKYSCIVDLTNFICEKLDINDIPSVDFFYEESNIYGYYSGIDNKLKINEKFIDDVPELIDTIPHEIRHAYQFDKSLNPKSKIDELYAANFQNYIRPEDDFEGYKSQLVESEADAFAKIFKNEFIRLIGGEN